MLAGRFKILDDPDKRLLALGRTLRNRILRKAVRAGAKPVRQAAKRLAPKLTGATAASLTVRISTHKRTGTVYAVVGPQRRYQFKRKGKVRSVGTPTKIAHLILFGTRPHSLKSGDSLGRTRVSKRTGKAVITPFRQTGRRHPGAKANPFLQRAWAEEMGPALAAMKAVLETELAKVDATTATAGEDG